MGSVHEYIVEKLGRGEKLHFTLIDPDKPGDIERISSLMIDAGTDAFLIGGSLAVTPEEASRVAKTLRRHGVPVIVFPGNINCLTPYADAVLFTVLVNSLEPYYLMGAQVAGAPIVKKYGLEPLPTAYLVLYSGTAVAHVGRIAPVPANKPEIAVAYALASEMIGMKYIYLEAGSGAVSPVPPEFPAAIKKHTRLIVIVGGGIRSVETVKTLLRSGADIIVTGTIVEKDPRLATDIVRAVKEF